MSPALWLCLVGAGLALLGLRLARGTPGATPALVARRAFQTLVLAVVVTGSLDALPWYAPRLLAATAGLWASAFGIALAAGRVLPATRLGAAADLLATNLAVFAALAELALRVVSAHSESPFLQRLDARSERVLAINRFAPGTLRMGFPTNSGGHYDDEFRRRRPGEQLVAMIGDSFSAGVVPHAYHFTTLVEERLGVPVANVGLPALGPWEYAILARDEVAPLDPSAVVVQLFVGNDVREALARAPRERAGLAAWLDPPGLLLAKLPPRWWRMLRTARGEPPGADEGAAAPAEGDLASALPWLADPMLEPPMFPEEVYLEIERKRAKDFTALDDGAVAEVARALQAVREANPSAPFFVVLIPDEAQVEDALWEKVGADLPGAGFRWRLQDLLARRLGEANVPCLDLLPVFRAVEPLADGDRHLYQLRDTHLNARGNRVAAEAIASFLAARLEGPKPVGGGSSASGDRRAAD